MKTLLTAVFVLCVTGLAAQVKLRSDVAPADSNKVIRMVCSPSARTQTPLILVNNREWVIANEPKDLDFLNPNSIESIRVIKNDKSLSAKYGDKVKGGIISIQLKQSVQPISILDFLRNNHPQLIQQRAKICVNGNLILAPGKMMIDPSVKLNAHLLTGRYKVNGESITESEQYVNITKAD